MVTNRDLPDTTFISESFILGLLNFWYDTNGIIFTFLASLKNEKKEKEKEFNHPDRSFMRASYALLLLVFVFRVDRGKYAPSILLSN